tara:strand:- start:300 stop:1142 length:843 start_codon:yes stop_codon:yes gene_type:complete
VEILKKSTDIYIFQKNKSNFINFCPKRGGIVTNWVINDNEILYFDHERFLDKNKSIRGGIPILFPICGSLENNSLFGENFLDLMQHGFARDQKWNYEFNKCNNTLSLFLSDNEITRKYYPYLFELKVEITLKIETLIFNIEIMNKSKTKMPVNFGLHPYFNISDFRNVNFIDYAKTCLNQKDNNLVKTEDLLKDKSKGIDLLMYSSGKTSFIDYGFKRKITIINPSPFDISVIWSDPPRQMLCLEPWTSPRNSLNSGFRKIEIMPNSSQKLFTSIVAENF